MNGAYSKFSKPFFRKIGEDPDVREDGTHTNVNSMNRYSSDGVWCLLTGHQTEWAARKKVDPAKFNTSVRADDPTAIAPD